MLEHAIYSVISPNGAASILWKDATKADKAAEAMKITALDMLEYEIIEGVIPEPKGGAHRNLSLQAEHIKSHLCLHLDEIRNLSGPQLRCDRYDKFRKIGKFTYI
jgi:acetyl-CoA carboxylase carboxyl transferase subunit alpha